MTLLLEVAPIRNLTGLLLALLLCGWAVAAENADPQKAKGLGAAAGSGIANTAAKSTERLREGTKLSDVTGTFQAVGADNISFLASGNKDSYRVLPNLALQRVSQSLEDNRALRQWTVSGTITEFRGANYLLMIKAIQMPDAEADAGR